MTHLDTDPDGISTSLLRQQTYWRTGKDLQLVRVDDLCPDHQRRLLDLLRRHAHHLHAKVVGEIHNQYLAGTMHDREYAGHMRDLRWSPEVWLEDTPLVRRLVQLVATEPRPPRRRRLLPARLRRWWG